MLSLSMVVLVLQTVCASTTLKIGISDWVVDTDLPYSRAITANFLMAEKHFNERRQEFISELAEDFIRKCPFNLSILRVCNDRGDTLIAMQDAFDYIMSDGVDALVGYSASDVAATATQLAFAAREIPLVSHWASSNRLNDPIKFPNFYRTFPNDEDVTNAVTGLAVQLKYTKIGIIHLDSDSGPEFAGILGKKLFDENIVLSKFSFTSDDPVSLQNAVVLALKSKLNVIVVACFYWDLVALAHSAVTNEMTKTHLWIITYIDRNPLPEELKNDPVLREFLYGSLRISNAIKSNERFQNYIKAWPSFDVADVNSRFPPFGFKNSSTRCRDLSDDAQLGANFFAEQTEPYRNVAGYQMWSLAYDSVISLGFAACSRWNSTLKLPRGRDLMNNIGNYVDFQGLSGRVKFEKSGDRVASTITFQLTNWRYSLQTPYGIEEAVVGVFNSTLRKFDLNGRVVFHQNEDWANVPPDYIAPPMSFDYYGYVRILGYVELGVIQMFLMICMTWLVYNRNHPVVLKSQLLFMLLVCGGCLIAVWSLFFLSVDDDPTRPVHFNPTNTCQAAPTVFFFGFQLAYAAIIAKQM